MNKILLVDKPAGWTSFDVVAKIRNEARRLTGNKKIKVGHAGTLDPFATGLLIVLVGSETKNQNNFMKQDKVYEATLKLGFTSTTGDPEGEVRPYLSDDIGGLEGNSPRSDRAIEESDVESVLRQFMGEILQVPPAYSAIKIDGQRAYKLAREGKEVELKPRKCVIYSLERIYYAYPELRLRVRCSSGTYVRSLACDIGKELGCGAYLTQLRRLAIGDNGVTEALSIAQVVSELGES